MTAAKTERLMGLLIMLLVQRRHVTKERIRDQLYAGLGDAAFEKKFERDKDDLRSLGVPIEVGSLDAYFDDEVGYRVSPDDFALPPIDLAADEAQVLGLAGKVWEHARLAGATADALRKLDAQGIDVDRSALDVAQPRIGAVEPAFATLWEAVVTRTPVAFDYATPGRGTATRHVQPWGVVRFSGRWYVTGLDTDRREERVFRLSRVVGDARLDGEPGAYRIPAGTDPREVARRLAPPVDVQPTELLVRAGTCASLRRDAESVDNDVVGPDGGPGWDRLRIARSVPADEVLACGPEAYVVAPEELRQTVIGRLTAAVGR